MIKGQCEPKKVFKKITQGKDLQKTSDKGEGLCKKGV